MTRSIGYINFIGDYDNFDQWKEKNKNIAGKKGILNHLKKEWEIPTQEYAETNEDKLKTYEGKPK